MAFRRKSTSAHHSQTQASVTTRYHYDNLNRITSKTYSGNPDGIVTPGVRYEYDVHNPAIPGVTSYSKGRRTRVATVDSYDAMGRATRSRQTTESQTYRFGSDTLEGYEYQRNGALRTMRLPTGRVLNYGHANSGQPVSVSSGTTGYVSTVTYADHGAVADMRLNGYGSRRQSATISVWRRRASR